MEQTMDRKKEIIRLATHVQKSLELKLNTVVGLRHVLAKDLATMESHHRKMVRQFTNLLRARNSKIIQEGYALCRQNYMDVGRWIAALNEIQTVQARFMDSSITIAPTLKTVTEELLAVDAEYGLNIDLKNKTFGVTTEEIVLERINFGKFKIVQCWRTLDPLFVALSPRCPQVSGGDRVTHPHVKDKLLCWGNARSAWLKALNTGRFFDAFSILVQTLKTYNSSSPHVKIEVWANQICGDCQAFVESSSRCHLCAAVRCSRCSRNCTYCLHNHCVRCSRSCIECRRTVCVTHAMACSFCYSILCTQHLYLVSGIGRQICSVCSLKCKECNRRYHISAFTPEGLCTSCVSRAARLAAEREASRQAAERERLEQDRLATAMQATLQGQSEQPTTEQPAEAQASVAVLTANQPAPQEAVQPVFQSPIPDFMVDESHDEDFPVITGWNQIRAS